jgi:hypothetical protein
MVDGSEQSIVNLKLVLYCFEWLLGLKINFHKSEVFVFGVSQGDKELLANKLNYALGELPMKYLGFHVSDSHITIASFSHIVQKIYKRLDHWKGKHLTSRGKHILTNSCLSSILSTAWGLIIFKMVSINKWIVLEQSSFGKGLMATLSTIWQNGRC